MFRLLHAIWPKSEDLHPTYLKATQPPSTRDTPLVTIEHVRQVTQIARLALINFEVKLQQEIEESNDIDHWLAHSPLVTGIQFESHGHCQKLEVVGSSLLPLAFGLKVALYPPSSLAKVINIFVVLVRKGLDVW